MVNSIAMNMMMSEYARFQQNPQQYLIEKNLQLPNGLLDNPQKAVEYIIKSNQGTAEQLNRFKPMLGMFKK